MKKFFHFIFVVVIMQLIYINKSEQTEGDKECDKYSETGAKTAIDCTNNVLSKENYVCCFIHYAVRDFNNSICMQVANTSASISNVVELFSNAKNVSVICNSQSFFYSLIPLVFGVLFLI